MHINTSHTANRAFMNKTLIEELILAGRGMGQLLVGRHDASDSFDLSYRGLAGSFVVFLIAVLFNALLPMAMGAQAAPGTFQTVSMVLILYGIQAGFAFVVLRQFGREDGFVPYLVCDNWATFYVTLLSALLAVARFSGGFVVVILAIAVIVIEINIARLIVTLRPLQIVGFLGAQLIGVMIGLLLLGMVFPGEFSDQSSVSSSEAPSISSFVAPS